MTYESEFKAEMDYTEKHFFQCFNVRTTVHDKMLSAFYDGQRAAYKRIDVEKPLSENQYRTLIYDAIGAFNSTSVGNPTSKSYLNGKVVAYTTAYNLARKYNEFKN